MTLRLACDRCGMRAKAEKLLRSRPTGKHYCLDMIGCDSRYYAAKAAEERKTA